MSRRGKLGEGYVKRLHVNQLAVRRNEPAVTVQTSEGPLRGSEAKILGPSVLIHRPDKPLSCGARVWIETRAAVELD